MKLDNNNFAEIDIIVLDEGTEGHELPLCKGPSVFIMGTREVNTTCSCSGCEHCAVHTDAAGNGFPLSLQRE